MASLNKVFLMGNLTRDPELRYTPSGTAVTDLPLAVNRSWTGKDNERKEEVLFVDVTVWERQAETCCQYLKKGRGVHVEGSLKMESWDDKTTGEKRTKIKIHAERVQFLGGREEGAGGAPSSEGDYAPPAARESAPRRPATGGTPGFDARGGANGPSRSVPASAAPRRPTPPPPVENEGEDEDIPF